MSFLDQMLQENESIMTGVTTAGIFLLVVVALRVVFRNQDIADKLRLPSRLFLVSLLLFIVMLLVTLYWPAATAAISIIAVFILSLAVVLAGAVGLFDLFLGRYRKILVSKIVRDVVILVVYIITIFVLLGRRGVDLTSILTTSAVLTAVIGFALQDLLSSIIAGLAIQIERPFGVGDWVRFDEQEGEVLELNWRSTKIKTLHHDIVVIPNNIVTHSAIINFSAPTEIHRRKLEIGLRYEAPPNLVKSSILKAVKSVEGVLTEPEPYVLLRSYDDFSINYNIYFFIRRFGRRERIADEVRTHLWYQLKRDGLSIPFPIRDINMRTVTTEDKEREREAELGKRADVLGRVPFLEPLSQAELRQLASGLKREYYAKGESVIVQGEKGDSFYVIAAGAVSVCIGKKQQVVATLKRGDFFGEMSLMTGEPRAATIIAKGDCEFHVIDKPTFQKIIAANDGLIAAIGEKLEDRKSSLDATKERAKKGSADADVDESSSLVFKIRRFFNIS